jgi:hypothetical protein
MHNSVPVGVMVGSLLEQVAEILLLFQVTADMHKHRTVTLMSGASLMPGKDGLYWVCLICVFFSPMVGRPGSVLCEHSGRCTGWILWVQTLHLFMLPQCSHQFCRHRLRKHCLAGPAAAAAGLVHFALACSYSLSHAFDIVESALNRTYFSKLHGLTHV